MNIKTFRFKESETFKIKEIKGHGGAPGSGNVKGEMSRRKVVGCCGVGSQRVLITVLPAATMGLTAGPCLVLALKAAGHGVQHRDIHGTPWTAWIGQYYRSGTVLPGCHGFADCFDRK